MKKLKLLFACIFLCTATTFADVQINETNFPDANFRAFVSGLVNGRDVITYAEISEVTEINISWHNISNLTGINFFTNLINLSAWNNQLSLLDVSDLANLETLYLGANWLTSLDVSSLLNLTSLCVGGNLLTSLNVSNLPNLASLRADWSHLNSLVVSNLPNLTSLDVTGNRLTSLDVSDLTNLINLSARNNQFTSLDVSDLTNLETLYLGGNQLISLDVSNLVNLAYLDVGGNLLTSLDLSNLTNLWMLRGGGQTPALTLTGANNSYSLAIELNNPTGFVTGVQYINGILTSTSNTIASSTFSVATDHPDIRQSFRLSGRLFFNYTAPTNLTEINLNRTPIAFYTITGVRLGQEPQSGIFIILYCDGSAEKVMK